MKILHISDLHFGPPFLPRVGESLRRAAESVSPDVIVVSGDLTQRAKPEQFEQAAEFLRQLPDAPRVVVPGNHDVPLYRIIERFTDPHRHYQRIISKELNTVLRTDEAVIVGLDSTAPRSAISNGRLHPSKLDFCRRVFENTPPELSRIVVAHHHFAPAPDYLRDRAMPKAKRAIKLFVDLGVELILGGHLHRSYIGNTLDFYPAAGRDHGIVIVQSGTSTSRRGRGREREKNTFNEIDLSQHAIRVTHHIYDDDTGIFAPLSRHEFARGSGRLSTQTDAVGKHGSAEWEAEFSR
ncbi:metallophosphoesterase family protein [Planctomycetes bacterium TBK1r]|uniref:Cyclic 3',5'-adenosine monophosphate phosphodiesterase n=1 Tax=Stieleria magnilauensis TaxID=2527963 RepID=A0ABX5XUQ7_9BACT|nr:cyclic 3',5'-adenosine monophosphate phosphodiesterase [Planctomycetes bacterium TBK1r]